MDERIYREYVAILKEELQPAMGLFLIHISEPTRRS